MFSFLQGIFFSFWMQNIPDLNLCQKSIETMLTCCKDISVTAAGNSGLLCLSRAVLSNLTGLAGWWGEHSSVMSWLWLPSTLRQTFNVERRTFSNFLTRQVMVKHGNEKIHFRCKLITSRNLEFSNHSLFFLMAAFPLWMFTVVSNTPQILLIKSEDSILYTDINPSNRAFSRFPLLHSSLMSC